MKAKQLNMDSMAEIQECKDPVFKRGLESGEEQKVRASSWQQQNYTSSDKWSLSCLQ